LWGASVAEDEDAGVFQIPSYDAYGVDVLAQTRNAGTEGAGTPDDGVDLDSGLAGFVEFFYHIGVHKAVDLDHHPGFFSGAGVGDFAVDGCVELAAHELGRDQQMGEDGVFEGVFQVVEQLGDFPPDALVGGEQGQVGVGGGIAVVEVAGADYGVVPQGNCRCDG
jgi:hypothetical protein